MASLHSHYNTSVSKIIVLIIIFTLALAVIVWNTRVTIAEIETHTQAIQNYL